MFKNQEVYSDIRTSSNHRATALLLMCLTAIIYKRFYFIFNMIDITSRFSQEMKTNGIKVGPESHNPLNGALWPTAG